MDYNLLSIVRSSPQTFLSNFPETAGVTSTNRNTNINVPSDVGQILKDLQSERLESGYNSAENIYTLLKSQGYRDYLKNVPDNEHISQCSKYGDLYADINGHEGFKPILCKDRNKCIIDVGIYIGGLSRDAFELLKAISDKWHNNGVGNYLDFWDDTFTLPDNIRERINDLGNEGKLMFWDTIKEYYRLMFGGMPALCLNYQTWSSTHPLDSVFNHNHVFGLNLFYKESSGFYSVNSFVDVDVSLSVWYGCVKRLAEKVNIQLEDDILNGEKSLVRPHHEYLAFNPLAYSTDDKGNKKSNYHLIKHAINYDMRKPIGDIVKWFDSSYKGSLTLSQKERMETLLFPSADKKRCQWVGWLADSVKNNYLSMLGLYVKSKKELNLEMKESVSEDAYSCPICGEIMTLKDGKGDLIHIKHAGKSIFLSEGMRWGRLKLKRVVPTYSGSYHSNADEGYDMVIDALIDAFTKEVE